MEISFTRTVQGVDWVALKTALREDNFDNGRTPEQLRDSFVNSYGVCFAWAKRKIIGKARVLSDGVCNAYMVDVWTHSAYRNQGVATEMIALLKHDLQGQHLYLQADDDVVPFYTKLGFQEQPKGMSCVIGQWLKQ